MNFINTPVHLVALVFILLELMLLCYQLFHYLSRPQDRQRLWYLILLLLLIHYNIFNGLFPGAAFNIPLKLQYTLAYGMSFLMGAYFLFYFYEAFGLRSLRFHVVYGIPCFLLVPFVVFIFLYWQNGELSLDKKIVAIIPLTYGLVVLVAMLKTIRQQYKLVQDRHRYGEQLSVWIAMLPWQGMAVFIVYPQHQELKIIMANLCLVVITLFSMVKATRHSRTEYQERLETVNQGFRTVAFEDNCRSYKLTKRETEISLLIRQGLAYKEIAAKLFISEKTVDNHVRNIYAKTGANNKITLLHKLYQ